MICITKTGTLSEETRLKVTKSKDLHKRVVYFVNGKSYNRKEFKKQFIIIEK
jgi:hypothetical protein